MHCPILGIKNISPRDSAGWSRSGGFPPCYQPDKYYVVSDGDYDGDGDGDKKDDALIPAASLGLLSWTLIFTFSLSFSLSLIQPM